ncbi:disease resistance protein RUN1-like isoform X1 [Arachis stenosperma]|uniref:disease resistance protein RUN1-like isoform X1 n=2 Tax=Arachis stenosperma TaxID=217475 RepID=UPI0025ACD8BD|nr:disease resistance protein RUN1-like isoform X1 [Arachis stenosperma]
MECVRIQSTLSHSHRRNWKYDVFVSFRGETCFNFTDHLYAALRKHCILAFRDDTKLEKGGPISAGLLEAIEGSQVLIVVFSINYASSTWCLQELANIADCIQIPGHTVLPVFYDVSPTEVRRQSGNFEKAFMKHEERFKDDAEMMEQVARWKGALTQVANLSGWDLKDKSQSAEIEKIVKAVTKILSPSSSLSNDVVGMYSHLEELEKLLVLDSHDDVRVLGICGMGGIGKSTLATILYEKISHQYDISCFMDDVSKTYADCGPIGVKKQLLCQAFVEEEFLLCNLSAATNLIQNNLCHRKVLIVLDNVDQRIQLENLALKREWLSRGSRIIIISRDEHILREHGVDDVYKVQLLNDENALQLFCRKAFKCNHVIEGYESLTNSALTYANGLPLAIKVLGSFLFGRSISEWSSALVRLRENPTKDIMDVLRISYDGLEDMEKEMFLDIACFFSNENEYYVKNILCIRGFHPDIGIRILIDKSLVTIVHGWKIVMHDLLRELGRSIVREKSPKEPRKWSRLWNQKDLSNVLRENKIAENLEAIVLPRFLEIREELSVEALSQMSCLKLLILREVNFSGCLNFLSNELGYLEWKEYPFTCLPSSFQPNKLVKLILHHSNIKELWEGIKDLHNLTHMELCYSKSLVKIPNLSQAPNLLRLDLKGCVKLVRLHPSIGCLKNLGYLNLENCRSLVSIPNNIFDLNSLYNLNLSGCWKLLKDQLSEKPRQSKQLNTGQSVQRHMTSSICKTLTRPLHFLSSRRCSNSIGLLVPSLSRFPALESLDISFCNLVEIPDAIGQLCCLERLNIGGNNFVTLPHCIKELPKLRELNLQYCKKLKWFPSTLLPIGGGSHGRLYYGGIFLFNCPNLSDTESCGVTVISWMIKMIQVNMQFSFPRCSIKVIIPGTEIPRWFNKQNTGNSMKVDPSPIVNDNNWIGIACCVAFVVHDAPTEYPPILFGCGFRRNPDKAVCSVAPIRLKKDWITTELDHMLLMFLSREVFINNFVSVLKEGVSDLDGIELVALTRYPEEVVEVKSCGYRWVFKEDLEHLNPEKMYSANSLAHNRKHKFLKIQDDQ